MCVGHGLTSLVFVVLIYRAEGVEETAREWRQKWEGGGGSEAAVARLTRMIQSMAALLKSSPLQPVIQWGFPLPIRMPIHCPMSTGSFPPIGDSKKPIPAYHPFGWEWDINPFLPLGWNSLLLSCLNGSPMMFSML